MKKEVFTVVFLLASLILILALSSCVPGASLMGALFSELFTKTCVEQNGDICEFNERCPDAALRASDANQCCSVACEALSCSSLSGNLCAANEQCTGTSLESAEGQCCVGSCQKLSCAEQNGVACSAQERCSATTLDADDVDLCCSESCEATSCVGQGGSVCTAQQQCSGQSIVTPDTPQNAACCLGSCTRKATTSTCNQNTLCEGWEDAASCVDCQCQGTVCGGICYAYDGICCGDAFVRTTAKQGTSSICSSTEIAAQHQQNLGCSVPGFCPHQNFKVSVSFDMPFSLEVNRTYDGSITIINDGPVDYAVTGFYLPYFPSYIRLDQDTVSNQSIPARSTRSFPLRLTATEIPNWKMGVYGRIMVSVGDRTGSLLYESPFFYPYVTAPVSRCGSYSFPYPGVCRNGVFYPGEKCISNGKDPQKPFCVNGMQLEQVDLVFGSSDFTGKYQTVGDRIARGHKRVALLSVNNSRIYDRSEVEKVLNEFYDKESLRITGHDLLSFEVSDFGDVSASIQQYSNKTLLFNDLIGRAGVRESDFDFVVAYLGPAATKLLNGSGGSYEETNGRIILGSTTDSYALAHEIAHGFNAIDLYFFESYGAACGSSFANCLMCGTPLLDSFRTKNEVHLCSAAYLGWGDVNGDGIMDLDNDNKDLVYIPPGFTSIEIDQMGVSIAQTSAGKKVALEFTVVDNHGDRINTSADVGIGYFTAAPTYQKLTTNNGYAYLTLQHDPSETIATVIIYASTFGKKANRSMTYDLNGPSFQGDRVRN